MADAVYCAASAFAIRSRDDRHDARRDRGAVPQRRPASPPPAVVGDHAVILVPLPAASPAPAPAAAMDPLEFRAWAESVGGWQAAATWLNERLGRRYSRVDTRRWGSPQDASHRPVPAPVSALLRS